MLFIKFLFIGCFTILESAAKRPSKTDQCQESGPWYFDKIQKKCCPCVLCQDEMDGRLPLGFNWNCVKFYNKNNDIRRKYVQIRKCATRNSGECCTLKQVQAGKCTIPFDVPQPKRITSKTLSSTTLTATTTNATTTYIMSSTTTSAPASTTTIPNTTPALVSTTFTTAAKSRIATKADAEVALIVISMLLGLILIVVIVVVVKKRCRDINPCSRELSYQKGCQSNDSSISGSVNDQKRLSGIEGKSNCGGADSLSSNRSSTCSRTDEIHVQPTIEPSVRRTKAGLDRAPNPTNTPEGIRDPLIRHPATQQVNSGFNTGIMVTGNFTYAPCHKCHQPPCPMQQPQNLVQSTPSAMGHSPQTFTPSDIGDETLPKMPVPDYSRERDVRVRKPFVSRDEHPNSTFLKDVRQYQSEYASESLRNGFAPRAGQRCSFEEPEAFNSEVTTVKEPASISVDNNRSATDSLLYTVPVQEENQGDDEQES